MQNNDIRHRADSAMIGKWCDNTVFAIFDSFHEPVFIMDQKGIIMEANVTFATRFSKRIEECVGKNVYDLLTHVLHKPEIAALRKQKAEEVLRTGKRLILDDEHEGQVSRSTFYPIHSFEGKITRLLVVAQDITVAKNNEVLLEKERQFNRIVTESIPGPFYICDENEKLTGWNNYLRDEIFGKTDLEMSDIDPFSVIHLDDRQLLRDKLNKLLTEGNEITVEIRVHPFQAPEYRWFLLNGKRVIIDGKPFLAGVGIDISSLKHAEDERRRFC